MKLARFSSTRLGMIFEMAQLAQVTEGRFNIDTEAHMKRLNSTVIYAHSNTAHLLFPRLDKDSIQLLGYSDAAFTNNHYLASLLGSPVLLIVKHKTAIPFAFKSYKSTRVTRSVLFI